MKQKTSLLSSLLLSPLNHLISNITIERYKILNDLNLKFIFNLCKSELFKENTVH